MLYREIIAVRSQIHTKHINAVCVGRTHNFCQLNLAVHKVSLSLSKRVTAKGMNDLADHLEHASHWFAYGEIEYQWTRLGNCIEKSIVGNRMI